MPLTTSKEVADLLQENEQIWNQNSNWRSYYEDLADYFLPRKSWITSIRTKGERVHFNFLYDSTAVRSLRFLAAGFHSNLTNPTSRWFALETRRKELMKRREVRFYFKEVEDKMFTVMESSNFYNVIQEFYTDFSLFGTGTYIMLDDVRDTVRFTEIPVGQVGRVVDANDRLMGVYRNFRLSARQAYKLWGNNAGESVLKAKDKKPFEEFQFLHFVGERFVRDVSKKDSSNMPFRSVWIAKKDKKIVAEGGFQEMPYISEVFYKDVNDANGFSPAMDVLAEVKLVNAMQKTFIRADMKQADPPLSVPSRGFMLPLNFNPAALNYRDAKTPNDALQALPFGNGGRLSVTKDHIQMVQQAIETGMFVPLFRSLNEITKQMTIPEVQRRVAENMALLGPVVGRCNHGVLGPTIVRLYGILNRNLMLPPPPESLQGEEFDPVYLSPLAKAQAQTEVADIQAFLSEVQAIGSLLPRALHKIDEDNVIEVLHRSRKITPEILRDEEEVKQLREQEQQQQAALTAMQAGDALSQIDKTSSEAERNRQTVKQ